MDSVLVRVATVQEAHLGIKFLRFSIVAMLLTTVSCQLDLKVSIEEQTNNNRIPRQISLLEDEMCLRSYDVSEGSIIRTRDSQNLGAKYINESDFGQGLKAREECFILCCRTPHCNVAVFEEKKTGSCYLFDCGPAEDFRCKFTSQPQYTSAILRKPVLQINQHENELTQLRVPDRGRESGDASNNAPKLNNPAVQQSIAWEKKPDASGVGNPPPTTAAPPIPHPPAPQTLPNSSNTATASEPQALTQRRSACSRNQFECKSSKECIAIYNACDGIPQCADGSDESSELNCPPETSNTGLIPPKSNVVVPQKPSAPLGPARTDIYGTTTYGGSGNFDRNQNHYVGPIENHANVMTQQEDMRLLPAQHLLSSPAQANENLNVMTTKDQVSPQYAVDPQQVQPALNIFAHKDGGIMDDTYGNQGTQRHTSYWKQSSFDYNGAEPPVSAGAANSYNVAHNPADNSGLQHSSYQYVPYQQQGVVPPHQPQQMRPYQNTNPGQTNTMQIVPIPKQQRPYPQQPVLYSRDGTNQVYSNTPVDYGSGWSNPNSAGISPNFSPNRPMLPLDSHSGSGTPTPVSNVLPSIPNTPPTAIAGVAASVTAGLNGTASPSPVRSLQDYSKLQLPQTMSKLSSEIRDFAAESENIMMDNTAGPGAVLAFIAGLIMSIAMVIIVGCRLRRIGTRRRGKNRLDPDFLVDGMYL